MPAPLVLKNATDSYVAERYPDKNYSNVDRIYVAEASAANTRHGFIYFGLPSGLNRATILSARLRIFTGNGWSGTSTVRLVRLASRWTASRITFNNMPAGVGVEEAITKTSPASGTVWDFDVAPMIQQVANGQPWYGFRISSTDNQGWFHSAQADDRYRPQLVITYTTAPYPPTVLIPSNGQAVSQAKPTLQWDFTDVSGDTSMASFHLRLFSSLALATANGAGDVLDLTQASSTPQIDLDDTAYAGLAVGATLWWRVRVQDGAGLWSSWSGVASFTRADKGTLTLTSPPASPAEIFDATPTFTWTFTGQTQRAYEAIISRPETPSKYLWTSGVVTTTAKAVTPPPGIVVTPGATYRLTLRVYDTVNRRTVPGDPVYVEVVRDFTLSLSAATAPVTNFAATPDPFRAWAQLTWSRSAAPDTFVIIRDGVVIAEVYPTDVDVTPGGTDYQYTDRTAKPRVAHTWSVAAKKDAIMSSANPTAVATPKLITTHLSDTGGGHEVFLFNPEVAAARAESSEVHYILGQAPPVLITQAIRGYEGTITGVIAQDLVSGLTSAAQLANLEYFKDNPGMQVRLTWVNKNLRVVLYNITDTPIPYPDGKIDYLVSMSFFEVGF